MLTPRKEGPSGCASARSIEIAPAGVQVLLYPSRLCECHCQIAMLKLPWCLILLNRRLRWIRDSPVSNRTRSMISFPRSSSPKGVLGKDKMACMVKIRDEYRVIPNARGNIQALGIDCDEHSLLPVETETHRFSLTNHDLIGRCGFFN